METNTRRVWSRYRIYQGENKIVADGLSSIPLNGKHDITNNSTYQQQIVSEINDIEELPDVNFSIHLKLIQKYQWAEPSIIAKYKNCKYHKGYFCGGSNIDIKLITFE